MPGLNDINFCHIAINKFILFSSGGNSTLMIAVMCSLLGVVLIGLILLFIYVKRNKQARENQRRRAQQQLTSPVSGQVPSHRNHSELRYPPPPYSSVVAGAPPLNASSTTIQVRPINR